MDYSTSGPGLEGVASGDRESPGAKRRKIRKGTRSCWECKRRKIRCDFASASDDRCVGCSNRGRYCLSQEHPEEPSRPAEKGQQIDGRIERVEALVEQLVRKVGNTSPRSDLQFGSSTSTIVPSSKTTPTARDDASASSRPASWTPGSDVELVQSEAVCNVSESEPACSAPTPSPNRERVELVNVAGQGLSPKLQQISRDLYAVIPPAKVICGIWNSGGRFARYFHQTQTASSPYTDIETATLPDRCAKLPSCDTHPVLIAKYMLTLAQYLQYIPHTPEIIERLDGSPGDLMRRLADAAISLLTTNEEFIGTIEFLECIILEGSYLANSGNLRKSWLAFRRAMILAQLMGFHRKRVPTVKKIDPTTKADPHFMWYRIQRSDRSLCLMLGLPAGSTDTWFASDAAMAHEPPMEKLERTVSAITLRVLERNDTGSDGGCSLTETQAIDLELQKVAKMMPSRWWLPPNLLRVCHNEDQADAFLETVRLINQIFYYNLLSQLHLPYLLLFSSDKNLVYNKLTCVNASREVLSRYVAFRSCNQVAFCCRAVDFFALMGSLILVLAHLHAKDEPDLSCLVHQRHSDRAMMEQVLESMEMVHGANRDVLSEKSAALLSRLLVVDADAAEGRRYNARSLIGGTGGRCGGGGGGGGGAGTQGGHSGESVKQTRVPCAESDEAGAVHEHREAGDKDLNILRMCIPYFGVIRIAREGGIISREAAAASLLEASGDGDGNGNTATIICPALQQEMDHAPSSNMMVQQQNQHQHQQQQLYPNVLHYDHAHDGFAQGLPTVVDGALAQEYVYPHPGLAASADDWAFQGVDMAFFDSLMRGLDGNAAIAQAENGTAALGELGNGTCWQ